MITQTVSPWYVFDGQYRPYRRIDISIKVLMFGLSSEAKTDFSMVPCVHYIFHYILSCLLNGDVCRTG